jgi:phosphohistidine phosphatase
MEIFLMRHGIAEDLPSGGEDADRQLTARGIAKTEQVATNLYTRGWQCDLILSSPLVRAQETAQILMEVGLSEALEIQPLLAPAGLLVDWLQWLAAYQETRPEPINRLMLVGHAPNLSQWAENLVFGHTFNRLRLKKAGVIALQAPSTGNILGECELMWLVPPKCWV